MINHLKFKGALIGKNVIFYSGVQVSLSPNCILKIGDDVVIDSDTNIMLLPNASLSIGDRSYIGKRNVISSGQSIQIGSDAMTAHQVTIIDSNHSFSDLSKPIKDQGGFFESISIADNVWIATGATILPGSSLQTHSIVAANSVVKGKFDKNVILGGIPASIIKQI